MFYCIKDKKMSDPTDSVCAPIQWGLNVRTVKSRAAVCQSVIATKEVL